MKPSVYTYEKTTNGIRISVTPVFIEEESDPEKNFYLWAYQVRIENLGKETCQLKERFWQITDGSGRKQEVTGAGVVGEQPTLKPGDAFEYTSTVPLPTASGFMQGNYAMRGTAGKPFLIDIPLFFLESPYEKKSVN
jgi:ApaG protein